MKLELLISRVKKLPRYDAECISTGSSSIYDFPYVEIVSNDEGDYVYYHDLIKLLDEMKDDFKFR